MEKKGNRRRAILAGLSAAALLGAAGCELLGFAEEDDEADDSIELSSKVYDGTKAGSTYDYLYIDLEDPDNPASEGGGTAWDIMITGQKEILTNSGVTATSLSSGGQGGVVFSGGTNIDADLSAADAAAAFAAAEAATAVDYAYWDKYKTSSATPTAASTGNAISFPGYLSQDGRDGQSADTAWVFGEVGAHVDVDFSLGTAYAKWERMAPAFSDFTNNVYYVRSGDGASWYKLQVAEAVYTSPSASNDGKTHYTYSVTFAKLD